MNRARLPKEEPALHPKSKQKIIGGAESPNSYRISVIESRISDELEAET